MVVTDIIVVNAVARRSMNAAGAAVQCNMVADNDQRFTVKERVLCFHVLAVLALKGSNDRVICLARFLHNLLIQGAGHNVVLIAAVNQGIIELRTKADRLIGRNGPCCGSPNDKVGMRKVCPFCRKHSLIVCYMEFYIDGITGVFLILNFRFC